MKHIEVKKAEPVLSISTSHHRLTGKKLDDSAADGFDQVQTDSFGRILTRVNQQLNGDLPMGTSSPCSSPGWTL